MVIVEKLEWRLAGETEVLEENLPQRHFVHHKFHMTRPGLNPGRRGGKIASNRLSYGAALNITYKTFFPATPNSSPTNILLLLLWVKVKVKLSTGLIN
jgi:hypothetical protein